MTTTPPINPGFDRLIVSVLVVIGVAFLALAFVGCKSPQELAEARAIKARAKAEKHLAEAILADPSILIPKVVRDTVVMWTQPTAIAAQRSYSQASVDSIASMCSDLLSVYRGQAETASWKYAELQRVRMRSHLCAFAPLDTTDGPCAIRVWEDGGRIAMFHNKTPEKCDTVYIYEDVAVDISAENKAVQKGRVKSRFWLGLIMGTVLGIFIGLFIRGSHRHTDYTPHLDNPLER